MSFKGKNSPSFLSSQSNKILLEIEINQNNIKNMFAGTLNLKLLI